MSQPAQIISKVEKEVEVVLTTGEKLNGIMFAKQYDRVSDILNDARPFVPFRDVNGVIRIISKEHIFQAIPREPGETGEPSPHKTQYIYPNRL